MIIEAYYYYYYYYYYLYLLRAEYSVEGSSLLQTRNFEDYRMWGN